MKKNHTGKNDLPISNEEIQRQIDLILKGNIPAKIIKPAIIGNGITRLTQEDLTKYLDLFNKEKNNYTLLKFVPASGAATRMFKEWTFFHRNFQTGKDFYKRFIKKNKLQTFEEDAEEFLDNLPAYAFYEDLMKIILRNNPGFHQLNEDEQVWQALHYILSDEGLGYQNMPKGLILFHRYSRDDKKTAMEEHLIEAEDYAKGQNEIAELHFSISPQYHNKFKETQKRLQENYQVNIQFSYQKPSTDTIMLDENSLPLKDEMGNYIFRPGGHGSLIENIQDLDADIIFIKNIDNVQKGEKKLDTLKYKKILGGILIEKLQKIKKYLFQLKNQKPIGDELKEIENFAKDALHIQMIDGFEQLDNSGKRKYLYYKLNRPIRIAGVVKNTGEPGGGPFWALDKNGMESLQIIEKAQIDFSDQNQKQIFENSTHFNPVDLAISIKDFEGNKFNLSEFVNENAGFITEKSYKGSPVKVYERPGLWNGAMDAWNTVFVEVPLSTFSPVKIVNDLLKPAHQ